MSSWWLAEPFAAIPHVPVSSPEVEIVGGGVTGVSAALALARAGVPVRLHEAREVASGASGRNGGFLLRGGAMGYQEARTWLGPDDARRYWRLTERALDELAELVGDAVDRCGSLRIANDEEERAELEEEYAALREDGFAVEWRDDVDGFHGAIFHPGDASCQPARMVRRLALLAAGAGAEIREGSRVASVAELEAERVLVCSDGYPSGLLGRLEGLIVPTRGQMLVTEPLAERLFTCPQYGRHGFDYWQQLPDGRLSLGGFRDFDFSSEFTDSEETTGTIQEALERFAARLAGRPLAVEQRWAGVFGFVPDLLPVLGPHPDDARVTVAAGYSGHGNVLGFLCGTLAAVGGDPEDGPLLDRFTPARLLLD